MRLRQLLLVLLLGAAVAVAVAGCGGGSKTASAANASTTTSTTGSGSGRGGVFSDPKVAACLKKAGVTVPSFGNGGRPNGGFRNRTTTNGAPPPAPTTTNGQAAPNGRRFNGDPSQFRAQMQKTQAALKKCGVTIPQRGQGGGYGRPGGGYGTPPGATQNGTSTPSNS